MRYLGKNFIYNDVTYGKFLTAVEDDAAAEILLASGYVEFPKEAPSKAHRWLYNTGPDGGAWSASLVVLRHYYDPTTNRFAHSAECAPDDAPAGFVECPTAPPDRDSKLYGTTDGGATWVLNLAVYKQRVDKQVKDEALRRSRESFNPSAFQTTYQDAAMAIQAATDKAGVDSVVAGIVWPA